MQKIDIYQPLKVDALKYNELKISVFYTLGGMNYFSGNKNPRGVYFSVTPVSRGSGFIQQTLLGDEFESGFKFILEEMPRFNAKKMQVWADKVSKLGEAITNLYTEKKNREIYELVKS